MIKKSQRLSLKQFEDVMQKGRVFHSSLFLLRVTTGNQDTRISAVAPLKIAKKAVVRNRIRRKIYTAVRPLAAKISDGAYGAIFAKKNVGPIDMEAITVDLLELFTKARLLA